MKTNKMYDILEIYHYTIGRSGSTFITQLLFEIFNEENVIAGHTPVIFDIEKPLIITYRDFRDVAVSAWRTNADISLKDLNNGLKMTEYEIEVAAKTIAEQIEHDLNKVKNNNSNVLYIKYSDFFPNNFDYIFNLFDNYFYYFDNNFKLNNKLKKELKDKYNFDRNKQRSKKYESFKQYKNNNLIHGKHIYKGKIGGWKDFVQPKHRRLINNILEPYLKEWCFKI